MRLQIASPAGHLEIDGVTAVKLLTTQGQIGILQHHADFIAQIKPGPFTVAADQTITGTLGEGFVRVEGGDVFIAVANWTK